MQDSGDVADATVRRAVIIVLGWLVVGVVGVVVVVAVVAVWDSGFCAFELCVC